MGGLVDVGDQLGVVVVVAVVAAVCVLGGAAAGKGREADSRHLGSKQEEDKDEVDNQRA